MKIKDFIQVSKGGETAYINPNEISHIIINKSYDNSSFIIVMKNGHNINADEKLFVEEIKKYEQDLENSKNS